MEAHTYTDDNMEIRDLFHPCKWDDNMSFAHQFQGRSSHGGPDPASSPFSEASFLPDWTHGSPGDQLFAQSPTVEVQQESIWLEASDDFPVEPQWFSGVGQKQRHVSSDDDLLKVVSPQEVIDGTHRRHLSGSDVFQMADVDLGITASESLLDNFILHPLNVEDESSDITELSFDRESKLNWFSVGENTSADVDGYSSSSSRRSFQELPLCPLQCQNEVGIYQKVPGSPVVPVELVDLDCDSLQDPESVFNILRGLVHSSTDLGAMKNSLTSEQILSPVSPEEVDTILSLDGLESSDESAEDSQSVVTDQFSTVSVEQLQQTISPSSSMVGAQTASSSTISEDYQQLSLSTKSNSENACRSLLMARPYAVPEIRREKKKEQNKNAALRYRQKKRQEKGVVLTEVDQLQLRNDELKAKLDDLNREIGYLRGLIEEINKQ
jgi:hypothetical protein